MSELNNLSSLLKEHVANQESIVHDGEEYVVPLTTATTSIHDRNPENYVGNVPPVVAPSMDNPIPVQIPTVSQERAQEFMNARNGTSPLPISTISEAPDEMDSFALLVDSFDKSPEWKDIAYSKYQIEYDTYKKHIVVTLGLTPESATEAANNRYRPILAGQISSVANNVAAEVIIDKRDNMGLLGLTSDEHAKLEKVSRLRLVVMEDKELSSLKIEKAPEGHKAQYIQSIANNLSKYSVPIPILGDYVGFKGAQIIQMANAISYEDTPLNEIVARKASLLYDKLLGGKHLVKYDSSGRIILSYEDFINKYPFNDIDIGMYAVICASSAETAETTLKCPHCQNTWEQKYSPRNLLQYESLKDIYKERMAKIIDNRSNQLELTKMSKDFYQATRYQSPFTKNVYDVSAPSIGRAITFIENINMDDANDAYISVAGMCLNAIYIYNANTDSHIEVTNENMQELVAALRDVPSEDIDLLGQQIGDAIMYSLDFMLDAKCTTCGRETKVPLNIESMIFLKAREATMEIDQ